ncbi:hypothetical protein Plhal304r1_c052g0136641 [Plasmopara halstedii]
MASILLSSRSCNRVLSATQLDHYFTFVTMWRKLMGTTGSTKRLDMVRACAKWWKPSESMRELNRATKALRIFELALMFIVLTIIVNDQCTQYPTGRLVEWIPAHNMQSLHPSTLLHLVRSDLRTHYMQR